LDKGGLLDVDAAGDDGLSGDDGIVVYETSPDEGGSTSDSAEDISLDETGPDVMADAMPEAGAGADAPVEARADAHADASVDAPVEAHVDAKVSDAPTDAPSDSTVGPPTDAVAPPDAPPDVVGPADAPSEAPASPIVWDGGPIVDPQFYNDNWVSFCVALVACGEMPGVSACVALLPQPYSPDALIPTPDIVYAVNNAAPDCRQVGRALGGGEACPSTTPDGCNGNSLVTCRWGFTMTVDCGDPGMVCSNGNGNAGCGFGDCSASQEGEAYCVGPNYLVTCTNGRYEPTLDCQTFGGMCVGPPGTAQCRGTGGTTCGGGGSCVGTSIVECMGSLLGSFDCSQLYDPNFACFIDDAGAPACAGGQSCDPSAATDTCGRQLTSVRFCNGGLDDTFDCTGNGYSGCDAGKCYP
jgi:hypothetical protein